MARIEKTFKTNGKTYASDDYLSYGDYVGTGLIGKSNIMSVLGGDHKSNPECGEIDMQSWVEEEESYYTQPDELKRVHLEWRDYKPESKFVMVIGDFGFRQLWLDMSDKENRRILEQLEEYPVLDESLYFHMEQEGIIETLGDDIFKEVNRELWRKFGGEEHVEFLQRLYYESPTVDEVVGNDWVDEYGVMVPTKWKEVVVELVRRVEEELEKGSRQLVD